MYGMSAITAANGWVSSVAGISIVFCGLVILSAVVASLERILSLWDKKALLWRNLQETFCGKDACTEDEFTPSAASDDVPETVSLTHEQREAVTYLEMIAVRIGEPFSLSHLLHHAEKHGIPRPHHHLDLLLKIDMIEECDHDWRGFYRWHKGTDG